MAKLFARDLQLGLAGFMLGAAALLLPSGAEQRPAPPRGDTDVLVQAGVAAPNTLSRG